LIQTSTIFKHFEDVLMTRSLKGLLAVALIVTAATNAQAGVFSVTPVVSGAFDSAFNPIPNPPGVPSVLGQPVVGNGVPTVYQVDFYLKVESLAPGEDSFGLAGFNIELLPGLVDAADIGWTPNNPPVDTNGALPGGTGNNMFGTNTDSGPSGTDEQGMLVQMATGAFTSAQDPRRSVGEADPFLIGTLYVEWDGTTTSALAVGGAQAAAKLANGSFVPGAALGGSVAFVYVPEPSSVALAGLSLIGLAFRRRAA
jgi:hypothetical protein